MVGSLKSKVKPYMYGLIGAILFIVFLILLQQTFWPAAWQQLIHFFLSLKELFHSVESLREFILSFGFWAPVIFFILQIIQVVLAPIPGGAVVVAGGYIFGTIPGLFLSLAGSLVGSVIVFLLGRHWGRPLVIKFVGQKLFDKYMGLFDKNGLLLFVIFLLPYLPDDAVCALAGLSKISLRRFTLLVLIGRIPSMLVTILITNGLLQGSFLLWLSIGTGILILLGIAFFFRNRLEAWILSKKPNRF